MIYQLGKRDKTFVALSGGRGNEFGGSSRFFVVLEFRVPQFLWWALPRLKLRDFYE